MSAPEEGKTPHSSSSNQTKQTSSACNAVANTPTRAAASWLQILLAFKDICYILEQHEYRNCIQQHCSRQAHLKASAMLG
jgi:hypothetical protein